MPLTSTGYTRTTLAERVVSLTTRLRAKISDKLDLSERTVLGNVLQIFAAALDEVEQLAEETYSAQDPDAATDDRFVAIANLTGVPRRQPDLGEVDVTLTLTSAFAGAAAGALIANVVDEPANRWVNRDAIPAGAGSVAAVFVSEDVGSEYRAEAGLLTVIAAGASGWTAITNAADASPGTDLESIEALRVRRAEAVSIGGSRTRGAIRAKLVLLDGVLSAEVFENPTSSTDANGIGPHNIRPIIWDGASEDADDNEVAQAIWDHSAEGIFSQGAESGVAQDDQLGPVTVHFDRASTIDVDVSVVIESADGVSADDVEAAIAAAFPTRVGQPVIYNRIAAAVFEVVGVDDWTTLTVNGGTADLPAIQNTIYLADDLVATGDVT